MHDHVRNKNDFIQLAPFEKRVLKRCPFLHRYNLKLNNMATYNFTFTSYFNVKSIEETSRKGKAENRRKEDFISFRRLHKTNF